MIKATIYTNKYHEFKGFDIHGHAGFAEEGSDIVCAAVSILVINTINAIESFTDEETSCVNNETDGMIKFRFKNRPSHDAALLINTMILGLESIEDDSDFEPYIDIIFKEV